MTEPQPGSRARHGVARRLVASERGAAAVELALVLPVLLLLLVGIMQFGMVFFVYNSMQHVAQEASRLVAVGSRTMAEIPDWAEERLMQLSSSYVITVEAVAAGDQNDIVVSIQVPLASAAIIDPLRLLPDTLIQARAVFREQQE